MESNNRKMKNGKHSPENRGESGGSSFKKINVLLAILIVVSLVVLVYRFNIIFFDGDDDNGNGGPITPPTKYTNGSIIPSRDAGIINGHEHIQDATQGEKWINAMDIAGISTTVMLGSPDATFWLHPEGPFNKYDENNEELLKLVYKYPDRFIAFPTVYTYDDYKLEKLQDYLARGAIGLKLFTGHYAVFYEHTGPLDISTMDPIYEYCETNHVPIIWHVHLGIDFLRDQFEVVLKMYPDLIINVPHFMLSSINLWQTNGQGRLRYYLETYPNLYTDISFGYWARDGLWRMSNHTQEFREFMIEFQDRFTFGTDMVCTVHPRKDTEWIANMTLAYRYIVEKENFNISATQDIEGDFNGDAPGTHNGLNLPKDVLDKIYYDNMIKFLNCRPYTDDLDDVIKNSKLRFQDQDQNTTRNDRTDQVESNDLNGGVIGISYGSLILIAVPLLKLKARCKRKGSIIGS